MQTMMLSARPAAMNNARSGGKPEPRVSATVAVVAGRHTLVDPAQPSVASTDLMSS